MGAAGIAAPNEGEPAPCHAALGAAWGAEDVEPTIRAAAVPAGPILG
jgi:hypothetical protein